MLILNEKKYAEELYYGKNNDIKSVIAKVGYITRYFMHACGLTDSSNYSNTVRWMKENHDNFDESCYSNLISDAVKKSHKKPFFNIESIKITKTELDSILSLNNLRAEKILFVLLCMAKQQSIAFGFTNGLVSYSLPNLCKMARISVPTEDREYIINYIVKSGLLKYPKKGSSNCLLVDFIDDNSEVVLDLDDIDCQELAYVYLNWKNNGKGYTRCEFCGRLMKSSKHIKNRYCKDCINIVGDVPDDMKVIKCVDCGKLVYVSVFNSATCRCEDCYTKYRRIQKTEEMRKLRGKNNCGQTL